MRVLIDLQETIDELRQYIVNPSMCVSDDETEIKRYNDGLETAISVMSGMPAVQHNREKGKWVPHDEQKEFGWGIVSGKGGVECSVCGYKTYNKMHKILLCPYHYCPMCGAEMSNNV